MSTEPMKSNGWVPMPWHPAAEAMLESHRLTLLVGDPGVGKTSFARRAARTRTGEEPEILQGTPETELAHVWGFFSLEGGETRFCDGPLPRALRAGRLLVVEEFSLIPLEVRASLLALREHAEITNPFTGERLAVPDAFRLVATSNPDNLSCRRNTQIAQALLDDFLILEVPPLEAAQVREVLRHRMPDADAATLDFVMAQWKALATIPSAPDGSRSAIRLSVRAALHLLALLRAGLAPGVAVQIALANKYIVDADAHETAKLRLALN